MKYRWIIFDADGTLFDYDSAESQALNKTLTDFNIKPTAEIIKKYRNINGSLFKALENGTIDLNKLKTERFFLLFKDLGISVDVKNFAEIYLSNLSKGSRLLPDAYETVEKLSTTVEMIILTNGISTVQRPRLGDSPIGKFFRDIIISDEVGCAKPAAEIFDISFKKMGDPSPKTVLMVGDSLTSDIKGGNDYGIDTCWIHPDATSGETSVATYQIDKLSELFNIVTNG